ncbi:hypothetical protein ACJX0J_009684 [Zea mays]
MEYQIPIWFVGSGYRVLSLCNICAPSLVELCSTCTTSNKKYHDVVLHFLPGVDLAKVENLALDDSIWKKLSGRALFLSNINYHQLTHYKAFVTARERRIAVEYHSHASILMLYHTILFDRPYLMVLVSVQQMILLGYRLLVQILYHPVSILWVVLHFLPGVDLAKVENLALDDSIWKKLSGRALFLSNINYHQLTHYKAFVTARERRIAVEYHSHASILMLYHTILFDRPYLMVLYLSVDVGLWSYVGFGK